MVVFIRVFFLEVGDVNLCALHCELRNTEQLLVSLGLTTYKCQSLKECNSVLAEYGPETGLRPHSCEAEGRPRF